MEEFKIESRNDLTFRLAYISPVEGLAIIPQLDTEDYTKAMTYYNFALEHVEVKVNDNWFPVKTKDRNTYMPIDIEKDWGALQELGKKVFEYLLENFPNSRK